MMNFTILIFEILRNKIKLYEGRQISQITEKVSNQEIFLIKVKIIKMLFLQDHKYIN